MSRSEAHLRAAMSPCAACNGSGREPGMDPSTDNFGEVRHYTCSTCEGFCWDSCPVGTRVYVTNHPDPDDVADLDPDDIGTTVEPTAGEVDQGDEEMCGFEHGGYVLVAWPGYREWRHLSELRVLDRSLTMVEAAATL